MQKLNNQKKEKMFESFEQFFKNIYPNSIQISLNKNEDPYYQGIEFANASIKKIKRILSN